MRVSFTAGNADDDNITPSFRVPTIIHSFDGERFIVCSVVWPLFFFHSYPEWKPR